MICVHEHCPDDRCVLDGEWWRDMASDEMLMVFTAYRMVMRDFYRYELKIAEYLGRQLSKQDA